MIDGAATRRLVRVLVKPERRRQIRAQVVALRARRPGALDALAQHYGTDKSSHGHGYTRHYQQHLAARRRRVRSVLEIGVGGTSSGGGYATLEGGQSLRVWRDYFPNAVVVGIDINAKSVSGPRICFEQGDQADPAFLGSLARRYGPFDLVIDDGSHIGRHMSASFQALWPAVKAGGFYVLEDLAVSYHPGWEGGPPGTPGTGADLVKNQIDDTLLRYMDSFRPGIAALHVYSQIAFLEKASSESNVSRA